MTMNTISREIEILDDDLPPPLPERRKSVYPWAERTWVLWAENKDEQASLVQRVKNAAQQAKMRFGGDVRFEVRPYAAKSGDAIRYGVRVWRLG